MKKTILTIIIFILIFAGAPFGYLKIKVMNAPKCDSEEVKETLTLLAARETKQILLYTGNGGSKATGLYQDLIDLNPTRIPQEERFCSASFYFKNPKTSEMALFTKTKIKITAVFPDDPLNAFKKPTFVVEDLEILNEFI